MTAGAGIRVAHVTTIDATLRDLLLHQLMAIRDAGFEVAGVSAPGPWTKDLEREGIRHYAVPSLNRLRNPLSDLRALVDLALLFRRAQFDIVHTHMPKTGVLGRLAARLAGVPIVINTVHGVYGIDRDRGLRRWFFLTIERIVGMASDYELCQGRELFELLTRLRILEPARSAYLGNGIDLRYFDPRAVDPAAVAALRREFNIPPGAPVVGTVGRMTWDKGYREFLAAQERVCNVRPDAVFVACGPTFDRDDLPQSAIEAAQARGVRFLGYRSEMREVYALMDLFVLATHREGFPRAAMEAAAMARPLVLTDIPGCRNVVTQGENGVLVPVRQAGPLAQAILSLLENPDLRRRYGEAGLNRALTEFDERQVFERIIGTYRKLLDVKEGSDVHGRLRAESAPRR